MKDIMVATDGSESAAEALDAAIELARQMGAKLHVLAVRPQRVYGHAGAGPAITEIEEIHGSEHIADAAVEHARAAGVDAAPHVDNGPVADRIAQVATELDADLVIVGSRGSGRAPRRSDRQRVARPRRPVSGPTHGRAPRRSARCRRVVSRISRWPGSARCRPRPPAVR